MKRFGLTQLNLIDIHPTGEADFIVVLAKPESIHDVLTQTEALDQLKASDYQPVYANLSLYACG